MNLRGNSTREDPEINFIPLIDVLLVILIFLMVTTTYQRVAELQITLPEADADQMKQRPKEINVGVDAQGRYVIDRATLTFTTVAALADALKSAAGEAKDPVVVVNADANATHQSVIHVMEAARAAGLVHLTFATQARASDASRPGLIECETRGMVLPCAARPGFHRRSIRAAHPIRATHDDLRRTPRRRVVRIATDAAHAAARAAVGAVRRRRRAAARALSRRRAARAQAAGAGGRHRQHHGRRERQDAPGRRTRERAGGARLAPRIVSRGYGRRTGAAGDAPLLVARDADPALAGDEPVLLARAGFPVAVAARSGRRGIRAAGGASGVRRDPRRRRAAALCASPATSRSR